MSVASMTAATSDATAGFRRHHRTACSVSGRPPARGSAGPRDTGAGRRPAPPADWYRSAGSRCDRLEHDRFQVARDRRVDRPRARRAGGRHLLDQLRAGSRRVERRPQRQQLVQRQARGRRRRPRWSPAPSNRSGAMYRSVPTMSPVLRSGRRRRRPWPGRSRSPRRCPGRSSSRLAGLMSRCSTPWAWA